MSGPDGKTVIHAELKIGDSRFFLGEEIPGMGCRSPDSLGGSPAGLYLYVRDVDEAFRKAVEAGATVKRPVEDMFWGDRTGSVQDPFGYAWDIATRRENVPPDEMKQRGKEFFGKQGAGPAEKGSGLRFVPGRRATMTARRRGGRTKAAGWGTGFVTVARTLHSPNVVAFRGGALYVAEIGRILRYDDIESRLSSLPEPVIVNDGFPKGEHDGGKFIRFGPADELNRPGRGSRFESVMRGKVGEFPSAGKKGIPDGSSPSIRKINSKSVAPGPERLLQTDPLIGGTTASSRRDTE